MKEPNYNSPFQNVDDFHQIFKTSKNYKGRKSESICKTTTSKY